MSGENLKPVLIAPDEHSSECATVISLYERGLYLQARDATMPWGEPKTWEGSTRIFGGRLAGNLGAARLQGYLVTTAFRRQPKSAEARLYYAYRCFSARGPWAAWEFLRDTDGLGEATPSVQASTLALQGHLAGVFRDRSSVDQLFQKAHAIDPESAWLWTEQSSTWELLDEPERAMEAARHAYEIGPTYRPAIQQIVSLLLNTNRDDEAEEILAQACAKLESGHLIQQWLVALSEREEWGRMPALCVEARRLFPWAEKPLLEWIDAREIDALCGLKNFDLAAALAEQQPDNDRQLQRIREMSAETRRIKLNVPFLRQDDATCAPASLASVAAHWGWDVTHDEIAEAICYGGTYPHGLREWVEGRGWVVREFKVTWDSCRQLIDRGVPFLLATTEVGSGHMQVVEGYDEGWGTILIRDPNFRHHRRVDSTSFLDRYRAFGPRGFVILPKHELERLNGVDLEAGAGFDRLYRLSLALQKNDRGEAVGQLAEMKSAQDEAFLLFAARLALSDYDANPLDRLRCLEEMEAAEFRHPLLKAMRLALIRDFRPPTDYLAALEEAASPHLSRELWDTSFLLTLAVELSSDEANHSRVRRLFQKYHALQPRDAGAMAFWGKQLWARQQREPALDLLKFASTSADKVEQFATDYFWATHLSGEETKAVELLRDRVTRYGQKSALPSRSLYSVLRSLYRDAEAFAVLSDSLQKRPADGELLLFCSYEWAAAGSRDEGKKLLVAAEKQSRRSDWLRASARQATLEGDPDGQLVCWEEIVRLEPFALDAHSEVALLINAKHGPLAAVSYWDKKRQDFPYHLAFAERAATAAIQVGEAFAIPYLKHCITLAPLSVPPRLDLIGLLLAQGQTSAATGEAESLSVQCPHVSSVWYWLGRVREDAGQTLLARSAYQQAIILDIDNGAAIRQLWFLTGNSLEQDETLRFLEGELHRQLFLEQGLHAWYDLAATRSSWDDLQPKLDAIRTRRNNCWAIWSCSLRNLLRGGRVTEATSLAEEVGHRFGLLPAAWLEVAAVQERALRLEQAIESFRQAILLDPYSSVGVAKLAWLLERQGRRDEALGILDQARKRNPLDAVIHAVAGDVLWRANRRPEAYASVQTALRMDSGLDWAWNQFRAWCVEENKFVSFRSFAAKLSEDHPGEVQAALVAARAFNDSRLSEQASEIVDRVLQLRPRLVDAHLLRTDILCGRGLYEEALLACEDPIWNGAPPVAMRGQSALIAHTQGNKFKAVELIRRAVKQDPSYAWGWERLCDWLVEMRRPEQALEAAQKAAELQPSRGYAWFQWANLHRQLGNAGEARRLFRETVAREPGFEIATLVLIENLLATGEVESAEEALDISRGALSSSFALAGSILISAKKKQRAETTLGLENLFQMPGVSFDLIRDLRQLLVIESRNLLSKTLQNVFKRPGIQPAAVACWVEEKLAAGVWRLGDSLIEVPYENEACREGLSYYLRRLPDYGQGEAASNLLVRYSEYIKGDDLLWASLGLCLTSTMPREVWGWTKDWPGRIAAAPWMLRAPAASALAIGQFSDAFAVSRAALMQETRDQSFGFHQLVVALEHALERRIKDAETAEQLAEPVVASAWDKNFAEVVAAVIQTQETPPREAKKVWRNAINNLRGRSLLTDPLIGFIVDAVADYLRMPHPAGVRPAPEANQWWQRPAYRWAVLSCAAGIASFFLGVVLSIAAGVLSSQGDSIVFQVTAVFAIILPVVGSVMGIAFAVISIRKKKRWTLLPACSLVGNLIIPAFALTMLIAAFLMSGPVVQVKSLAEEYYRHPEKAFSINMRGLSDVVTMPMHKSPTQPSEGIIIKNPDGSVVTVSALPQVSGDIVDAETLVLREMAISNDSVISKYKFVDQNGRAWLRAVLSDPHPEGGRPVLSHRDITAVGSYIVFCQFSDLGEKRSQLKGENVLDDWHRRIIFPQEEKKNVDPLPPLPVGDGDAALAEAYSLTAQKDYNGALAKFMLALAVQPKNAAILVGIADANLRLGQADKAVGFAEKATDLAPADGAAWGVLIKSMVAEKRFNEAKYTIDKAMPLAWFSPELSRAIGSFYQSQKEWTRAVDAYSKAIDAQPENREDWFHLMECYNETHNWAAAQMKAKELLEGRRDSAVGWYYLGVAQAQGGMPRIALAALQQAIEMEPGDSDAWNVMGLSYLALKEPAEAKKCFKTSVEKTPTHSEAWNNLGYAEFSDGAVTTAIDCYKKALKAEPRHTLALINLVNAYVAAGESSLAYQTCDTLAEIDSTTAAQLRSKIH